MINYYDKNRFISKSTLARLADVSLRTFSRYLQSRRHVLDAMGISPKAQKLPPQAVRYICEDYCIDLPPELQNQQALRASPIRDIILKSWEEEREVRCKRKKNDEIGQSRTAPFPNVVPLQRQSREIATAASNGRNCEH